MKLSIYLVSFVCSMAVSMHLHASQPLVFESGTDRVTLLELYSSQGCSSCPPAEKWVNRFSLSDTLWQKHIPVVFHVDYWDYLGWEDPFAEKAYSTRQRNFQQQGLSHSVYTPGFVLNGREWRGWFKRRNIPQTSGSAGNLQAKISGSQLQASYSRFEPEHVLNVAVLGFGLKTHVKRGENRRRVLIQDFVVLHYSKLSPTNEYFVGEINLPESNAKRHGLALWITKGDSLIPEQATGNWLPDRFVDEVIPIRKENSLFSER